MSIKNVTEWKTTVIGFLLIAFGLVEYYRGDINGYVNSLIIGLGVYFLIAKDEAIAMFKRLLEGLITRIIGKK